MNKHFSLPPSRGDEQALLPPTSPSSLNDPPFRRNLSWFGISLANLKTYTINKAVDSLTQFKL